ncbi:MAG: sugar 3,4-ketoisomerase [Alphaproteobacteria bacterium]
MKNLLTRITPIADSRGAIVALEALREHVPFDIKRVYYMYDLQHDKPRGHHAHKVTDQILICLHGGCDVLMDDGVCESTYTLSAPYEILHIPPMYWHTLSNFLDSTVIMAIASERYNESDYIRQYTDFIDLVQAQQASKAEK